MHLIETSSTILLGWLAALRIGARTWCPLRPTYGRAVGTCPVRMFAQWHTSLPKSAHSTAHVPYDSNSDLPLLWNMSLLSSVGTEPIYSMVSSNNLLT